MSSNQLQNSEKYFNDEISLRDLLELTKIKINQILNFKKILILFSVIGILFGYFLFKIQVIKYKAEINFVLDDEKQESISGVSSVASQLGFGLGSSANGIFSGENLIYLFKSRSIIEKTLLSKITINNKSITLADYYLKQKNVKSNNLIFFENAKIDSLNKEQIEILSSIRSDILEEVLDVKQKDKKTSLITIEVISKNEIFSKLFCEKITEIVSSFYIETRSKKAKLNRDILQKQVDSVKNELNIAIDGVANANDKAYNFNPAFLITKTTSTKRNIDIQANSAILTQLVANLEMSKITLRKETPLIQIVDYPVLPLDKIELTLFKSILIGLFISLIISILVIFYLKNK